MILNQKLSLVSCIISSVVLYSAAQRCEQSQDVPVILSNSEDRFVTVCFGGTVTIDCKIQGTDQRPSWEINSTSYTSLTRLPPHHRFNGTVLTIENVDMSLNNVTYQCYFTSLDDDFEFCRIESHKTTLTVLPPDTCVCETEDKKFCSCLKDGVGAEFSIDDSGMMMISCQSHLSTNIYLKIEIESNAVSNHYVNNTSCINYSAAHLVNDICATQYTLSATLISADASATNIHSKCQLHSINFSSSKCQGGKMKPRRVAGVIGGVCALISVTVTIIIIASACFIKRRCRDYWKNRSARNICRKHICRKMDNFIQQRRRNHEVSQNRVSPNDIPNPTILQCCNCCNFSCQNPK